MKKKYITPELEVIEIGLDGIMLCMSNDGEDVVTPDPPGPDVEDPFGGRDVNSRPGSGNVWDQNW